LLFATHLVVFLVGVTLFKKASKRLHCFKSYQDEVWQDCSSSKYASIEGVGFFAMTSYFQDGGHDVSLPLAPASAGCPLAH